mmetsp:Transcript_10418/g.63648  ORF Transcript_10418/g.63648 Transcript_10418/m.63648 type:complete len:81 (+) Transcript_10418:143-385(+)
MYSFAHALDHANWGRPILRMVDRLVAASLEFYLVCDVENESVLLGIEDSNESSRRQVSMRSRHAARQDFSFEVHVRSFVA